MAVMTVYATQARLLDAFTDYLLIHRVYRHSRLPENFGNEAFLVTITISFICAISAYLIAYSAMLNIELASGSYEPAAMRKRSCCLYVFRIGFLSCLGPLYLILIEIIQWFRAVFALLALVCGKAGVNAVDNFFDKVFQTLFDMNRYQLEGLDAQFRNTQLLFESFPMLILQIFILNGSLSGVLSHEEDPDAIVHDMTLLKIAFGTTILSIVSSMVNNYVEANAVQEPFMLYTL